MKNGMKSVNIIYGLAEGPWLGKQMRSALTNAGYRFEPDPKKADIIITHSGGCFFLPKANKAQKIILIGPPYWPGKSLIMSLLQKIKYDFIYRKREGNLKYLLHKTCWNIIYIALDMLNIFNMARLFNKRDLMDCLPSKKLIIIRNKDDAWCTPDIQSIPTKNTIQFYILPGDHDDCWIHPKPYIKVIGSL